MNNSIVLDDEVDLKRHRKRGDQNDVFKRGDWSEKLWEDETFMEGPRADEIFDTIIAASSVYHENKKHDFKKLIITSYRSISYGHYEGYVFTGTGRMYLKNLEFPHEYVPEHMKYWFPCPRYLVVGFTITDTQDVMNVNGLFFCDNGRVISKYDVKSNQYRVELPWV